MTLDLNYYKQIAERVNRERELERAEALRRKDEPKKEEPVQEERKAQRIIAPSEITNPQDYIMLEGKTYPDYSYPELFVAKERSYLYKNWNECKEAVKQEGGYMLTIRQFADFLLLLKSGKAFDGSGRKIDSKELENLFLDITEVRSPYRAEWLDAKFEKDRIEYEEICEDKGFFRANKKISGALMEDKNPGIDLDSWLKTADEYGLPNKKTKEGELYYWFPRNGAVAEFGADSVRAFLYCGGGPDDRSAGLGVRLASTLQSAKQSPKN